MNASPLFSVCIPAYNVAHILGATIRSALAQTVTDFELIIVDDASTDGTAEVARSFGDPRVRLERNASNLGYPGNLARCFSLARGTFVYLLGNDDVLSPYALARALEAFALDPDVAIITRPYYWFEGDDVSRPVRHVPPLDARQDRVVSVDADDTTLIAVFETLGQFSSLAFRREMIEGEVDPPVFTAHVRPFLTTWKKHKAVFLHDYVVAVRTESSQTRYLPSIYEPSPIWTWVQLFQSVFAEQRFARQRRLACWNIAGHVYGLAQIRCRAAYRIYLREAAIMVRYRPQNLLRPAFWATFLGFALLPRAVLIPLVDRLKGPLTGTSRRPITLSGHAIAGSVQP
ncbi:MAG: glycosyltransferase family 2 protein [Candidatus Eremiobacteraeota bacterium]|nr:glycosyltransferase family 2 protein [Candidatus Eremiobacteraeota bacterium]